MMTMGRTWQEHAPGGESYRNSTEAHEPGITHRILYRIKRLIRHQHRLLELRREQQQLRQELVEIRRLITTPQTKH
jgi:cell fate (sporulation/competence/biofilm development) regulator YlbF (YheA/YmcA/DUF963 family)